MARTAKARTASRKNHPSHGNLASVQVRNRPLRDLTAEALDHYFHDLNGHRPGDLYDLVLGEVERPLFRSVMDYTHGNQSQAAEILGINRATLRKKLRHYQIVN